MASALLSRAALGAAAIGHASVTILPASGGVAEAMPMHFDAPGATTPAGRIVLSPTGNGAGIVTITGEPNTAVTVSFSGGAGTAAGGTMLVGSFTHNAGKSPALDGAGRLTLTVGAAITMAAPQSHGAYAGIYSVVVNY